MKLTAPLLSALFALGTLACPSVASAARHSKAPAIAFPMKADEYKKLAEARIDKVRAVIDRKLDRAGVTPDRKKEIHKTIDEASKETRAEIARATADGTVTQAEADKVKKLVLEIRGNVRERLAAERKARARKAKGEDPGGKGSKPAKKDRKAASDKDRKPVKDEPEKKPASDAKPAPSGGDDGER